MPDWEEHSPQLIHNLETVLSTIRDQALRREPISAADAKDWHTDIMHNLKVPSPEFVGRFRGEAGLEHIDVTIGKHKGTSPEQVADELAAFITHLSRAVAFLDALVPAGTVLNAENLDAVIDVCAWVHAEWVRIHPFANGNGRTARLWANSIAMRYGLPPFVQLRPRPEGDRYTLAGTDAMNGDWQPTTELFRDMLDAFLLR